MLDVTSVVGIDVSKATLDVAFGADPSVRKFDNTRKGHRELARVLDAYRPARIVLEATGGYEHPVLRHLVDRGLPALRVNPRQVRDFARAAGVLAKTDAIDAGVLVRFGAAVEPRPRPLPPEHRELLARLSTRRTQLVHARTAEVNRLEQETHRFLKRTIREMIEAFDEQIEKIEAESAELIARHKELERAFEILTSVPGVGPATAGVLLGQMPELGSLSRQEIAALAGLAPFNQDSGSHRGQRRVRGGRPEVRAMLYMATLTGVRHGLHPLLAEYFKRLTAAGKPHKVAMTACMRKLLTLLNALLRDNARWDDEPRSKVP